MTATGEQGKLAEKIALQYLQSQSLELRNRNYHCRYGEIDLVMQDNDTLVFVEVRFRKNQNFGGAIASIDQRKQNKLRLTAEHYLQKHQWKKNARFDVVTLSSLTDNQQISWIKCAFE